MLTTLLLSTRRPWVGNPTEQTGSGTSSRYEALQKFVTACATCSDGLEALASEFGELAGTAIEPVPIVAEVRVEPPHPASKTPTQATSAMQSFIPPNDSPCFHTADVDHRDGSGDRRSRLRPRSQWAAPVALLPGDTRERCLTHRGALCRHRYALLRRDRTTLAAVYSTAPGYASGRYGNWIRNPRGMPSGLSRPVLSDDHGHFSAPVRAKPAGRLDEPWRSLVARAGRQDGPKGTIAVGAVTGEFDRHRVAILAIDSGPNGFTVEAEVTPPDEAYRRVPVIDDRGLVWWARDDRGSHYLGTWASWSGGDGTMTGELRFWPPLDPTAARLELMPTAINARAVIPGPSPSSASRAIRRTRSDAAASASASR